MAKRRKSLKPSTRSTRESAPAVPPATPASAAQAAAPVPALQARLSYTQVVTLTLCAILGVGLHVLHVLTGPPNTDEHVHLHFLWLTSQGILPRDGFLCPYPPTAYYLFAPIMRLLPETPQIFMSLRWLAAIPTAAFVLFAGLLAQRLGRSALLAAAWVLAALASSEFPTFWEFRFDSLSWSLTLAAILLLLGPETHRRQAAAAALVSLSVLIAPKHALAMAGLALGYGLYCLNKAPRQFPRTLAVAIGGALLPVLALSILRPQFIADAVDLSLMNIRSQAGSKYPVDLIESVLGFVIGYPFLSLSLWAGPVLFLLRAGSLDRKVRWTLIGLLFGNAATLATLPCGYHQYVSLVWVLFLPFLAWALPARGGDWTALALSIVLMVHLGGFAGRDFVRLQEEPMLEKQLRLQAVLARICPPGDLDAATPFGHTWCRESPGYVFIDNRPSYVHSVRPARRPVFTEEYYYERLVARPPAFDLPFTTTDGQPEAYVKARRRFLDTYSSDYVLGWLYYDGHSALHDHRLHLYIRKDRVPYAAGFTRMEGKFHF